MAILNRVSSLPTIGYAILPALVDQVISRIFLNAFLPQDRLIVRSLAGIAIWGALVPRHLKILSVVVGLIYTMIVALQGSSTTSKPPKNQMPFLLLNENRFEEFKKQLEANPAMWNQKQDNLNVLQIAVLRSISLDKIKWLYSKNQELANELTSKGCNILHLAVKVGDLPVIEFLYKENPDWINQSTNYQQGCLALAAKKGHFDVLDWLYDQIPEIKTELWYGVLQSALWGENSISIFDWAKQKNVNFSQIPEGLQSLIHAAVEVGDLPVIEFLYKENPDWINQLTEYQEHPLHLAVYEDDFDVFKWLYEHIPEEKRKDLIKQKPSSKDCVLASPIYIQNLSSFLKTPPRFSGGSK